jgi:hypothetical protein
MMMAVVSPMTAGSGHEPNRQQREQRDGFHSFSFCFTRFVPLIFNCLC